MQRTVWKIKTQKIFNFNAGRIINNFNRWISILFSFCCLPFATICLRKIHKGIHRWPTGNEYSHLLVHFCVRINFAISHWCISNMRIALSKRKKKLIKDVKKKQIGKSPTHCCMVIMSNELCVAEREVREINPSITKCNAFTSINLFSVAQNCWVFSRDARILQKWAAMHNPITLFKFRLRLRQMKWWKFTK